MRRLLLVLLPLLLGAQCVPGVPPVPGAPREGFRLPALHAEPDPVSGGRVVDAHGRDVLLRGVNVNAFVEYWAYDPARFTTYPFSEADADLLAELGFTVVRLLLSWSRVEPEPGVYDEAYLDEIEAAVRLLESRGMYSLIDLHQDAWGPSLAAREEEACDALSPPAFGWDGAPGWATLDGGAPRCAFGGVRELSPAVVTSFDAFWADAPGPGGVGIRARYAAMLGHLAARFAPLDAVAGYDVMNEPNALVFEPGAAESLSAFYAAALAAVRAGEASAGAPRRLFVFEPSILWADLSVGGPLPFGADDQVLYAPHLYQGGISATPLSEAVFEKARAEAAVHGGAPVLSGEWGGDPGRAADPADGYFERHQALQDAFRFGATLWTWREACGDPHKAGDVRAGRVPVVWGFFDVDCTVDQVVGRREALFAAMRRPLVRAAPGRLGHVAWDPAARRLELAGETRGPWQSFVLFVPSETGAPPDVVHAAGLRGIRARPGPGGSHYLVGFAPGGPWELAVEAR